MYRWMLELIACAEELKDCGSAVERQSGKLGYQQSRAKGLSLLSLSSSHDMRFGQWDRD